jgi:hypothetical protein
MTRSSLALVLVLKTGLVVALTAAPALGAARDHLPLRFEAQEGEVARFVARTASHTVVIAPNRVELPPARARAPASVLRGRAQRGRAARRDRGGPQQSLPRQRPPAMARGRPQLKHRRIGIAATT